MHCQPCSFKLSKMKFQTSGSLQKRCRNSVYSQWLRCSRMWCSVQASFREAPLNWNETAKLGLFVSLAHLLSSPAFSSHLLIYFNLRSLLGEGFSNSNSKDGSLLWGLPCAFVECLAASLASPHQVPEAVVTTKTSPRHCHASLGRGMGFPKCPWLRAIALGTWQVMMIIIFTFLTKVAIALQEIAKGTK